MKISRKYKKPFGGELRFRFGGLDSGGFAASFADRGSQALDTLEVLRTAGRQQRDSILLLDKAEDLQQAKRVDLSGGDKQFGFGDAAFWDHVTRDEFRQIAFDAQ